MRIVRNFQSRSAEEQRWLLRNTWCGACNGADLGLNIPFEYEEDGVVYVSGSCRSCGGTVTSIVSDVNESASSPLEQYSVVRVRQLLQPPGTYDGWRKNQRSPQIGDIGAVIEILDVPGITRKYVVESCTKDGFTVWLSEFYAEELELASSNAA